MLDINKGIFPAEDHLCKCAGPMCIGCEGFAHEPMLCKEASEWRQNLEGQMNKLNKLWIYQNTKPCPWCNKSIEKNGGCPHMTCSQCKNSWCWTCDQKYKLGMHSCLYGSVGTIKKSEGKEGARKLNEAR